MFLLVPAHPGSPGQGPLNCRVCVNVCVYGLKKGMSFSLHDLPYAISCIISDVGNMQSKLCIAVVVCLLV